jgi:GIY-YIG catalytic domain
MGSKNQRVAGYVRMWPREVFDRIDANGSRRQALVESLQLFDKPGVYVLYRDDVPYYVGQATRLRRRIRKHAGQPGSRYYNFWNFFSAFVIEDRSTRDEIEGVLIAAMPTANGAKPRLPKEKLPKSVIDMMREIRRNCANPRQSDHAR